jgi:predicted nucleic acid-binding protein
MQGALFDTSIYVNAMRRGDEAVLALRRVNAELPLWVSAVVLEELYAGAGDRARRAVKRLEREFDGIRRILVPNLRDWSDAGEVLARLAAKYGYEQVGRGRLTNDALIAMSASRLGIRIITADDGDFRRLAEFRAFQWQVATV